MFEQAIAASLVASGVAETISLTGKKVYQKVDGVLSKSDREILTQEFAAALSNSLPEDEEISSSEIERLLRPVNSIAVDSVYQRREEVARQIAVQLSTTWDGSDILPPENMQEVVEEALDEAVASWFDHIQGTETAHRVLLEVARNTEAQVEAIQEQLDTLLEEHKQERWYTRIDVQSVEEASKKVSRELDSGRPTTTDIYVNRPEIPQEPNQDKYLVVGRHGMGKTRTVDRLQRRFLQQRNIDHVIIPADGFVGREDVRGFSQESFTGDVLLIWDDIHGMRSGEQGVTVRETILRLSEKLSESDSSIYVLATVRSEFLDDIEYINRPSDRVWGEFEQVKLQPLDKSTVGELTDQVLDVYNLEVSAEERVEIAFEIWYSDPSPLYVESVISALDNTGDFREQVADLPQDVSGIWEQQYNRLISEHPDTRFILRGISLLRMGAIPIYESTIRQVYSEVFDRDVFEFDRQKQILLDKQWIWVSENPGPDVTETVYDIRGAQLSAIDEQRMEVMERFANFLLNTLAETVPDEVSDWIPHYHSNVGLFFAHEFIEGTLSLAEPQLERADSLAPFNPAVQNNYATFLQITGRPDEALAHYEKALTAAPEWAAIRNTYATTLDELGRPYEALEQYTEAIDANQPHPPAYYNRGVLYIDLGETQQAKRDFERALSHGFHDEAVYGNLGTIYWSSGDYLRGKEILEEGLESFPNSIEIRCSLAGLLYDLEYPERARDLLLPLLEDEDQTNARVHSRLALVYADLGQKDLVKEHASKAEQAENGVSLLDSDFLKKVEINDITKRDDLKSKPISLRVIDALLREDNYSKAWEKRGQLLDKHGETSEIHQRMGGIAEELELFEEADTHYQKATSLNSDNGEAFHHYGNFLKHRGRCEEAQKQFERAVEVSENPVVFNDFGLLHFQNGDYADAATLFEQGIEITQDHPTPAFKAKRLHHNYGQLLFYTGATASARAHYLQAIEYDEEYANAKFGLAQVESDNGDLNTAIELFTESLTIHANEGRFQKWSKVLLETLRTLSANGRYKEAIEKCEYGIKISENAGYMGSHLIPILQSRKEEYESEM